MRTYIYIAMLAVVITACSSNDPVSPVPTGTKIPAVGSTYEFSTYRTGMDGRKISGSDSAFVQTVLASGIVFGGKTGVWSVESKDAVSGEPSDTLYLCIDSKQDVLLFFPDLSVDGAPKWIRLPITTGSAFADSTSATEDFNGIPVEFTLKVKTERGTDESIAVGASSVATKKINMTLSVRVSAMGNELEAFEQKAYLWFAPNLGVFAQSSSDAVDVGGDVQDGEFTKLTKYSLK